jgi:hypothetical protein
MRIEMKKLTVYLLTTAMAALALSTGVIAFAETDPAAIAASAQMERSREAGALLGETLTARYLLEIKQPESAKEHIMKAMETASALVKEAPDLVVTGDMKFGKTNYVFEGAEKDYLVPVIEDKFAVNDYDTVLGKHTEGMVAEKDSHVVLYDLELNVASAMTALGEADSKLKTGDQKGAWQALDGVVQSALVKEVAYDEPLKAVQDNLVVALLHIQHKSFGEAGYALDHAEKEMGALEAQGKWVDHMAAVQRIKGELSVVKASLLRKDPSVLAEAEMKVSSWLKELKGWDQATKG